MKWLPIRARINPSRARTSLASRLIAEQICGLAGGGCHYSGDSMRDVHANHNATQTEFFGLVEDLRRARRRHHVGLRERNERLAPGTDGPRISSRR
jgi:hypothetical protein